MVFFNLRNLEPFHLGTWEVPTFVQHKCHDQGQLPTASVRFTAPVQPSSSQTNRPVRLWYSWSLAAEKGWERWADWCWLRLICWKYYNYNLSIFLMAQPAIIFGSTIVQSGLYKRAGADWHFVTSLVCPLALHRRLFQLGKLNNFRCPTSPFSKQGNVFTFAFEGGQLKTYSTSFVLSYILSIFFQKLYA